MHESKSLLLLSSVFMLAPCMAQEVTLAFETSNMELAVNMDRQTYLPGEEAQITLKITNRSGSSVVSLKPFVTSTSCVYYTEKDDPWRRASAAMSESCAGAAVNSSNTTTYAPGEAKEMVMYSYDKLFDGGRTVLLDRAVPTTRGAYVLFFRYGSTTSQVEFTVAPAKLEADAMARVQDIMFSERPKKIPPQPLPMYVHVLALRSGEESYICVQQATVSNTSLVARKEFVNMGLDVQDPRVALGTVTPMKRVATSSAPVVSLSATADANENLAIEWTDTVGLKAHFYYPASYPARSKPRNR